MEITVSGFYGQFQVIIKLDAATPDAIKMAMLTIASAGITPEPSDSVATQKPERWQVTKVLRQEYTNEKGELKRRLAFYSERGKYPTGYTWINEDNIAVKEFEAASGMIYQDLPIHAYNTLPQNNSSDKIILLHIPFYLIKIPTGKTEKGITYDVFIGEQVGPTHQNQLGAGGGAANDDDYTDGESHIWHDLVLPEAAYPDAPRKMNRADWLHWLGLCEVNADDFAQKIYEYTDFASMPMPQNRDRFLADFATYVKYHKPASVTELRAIYEFLDDNVLSKSMLAAHFQVNRISDIFAPLSEVLAALEDLYGLKDE